MAEITPHSSEAYIGMNLNNLIRRIKPGMLTYALNAVVENFDGQSVAYQNEQANVLCASVPEGYRIIGTKSIIEKNIVVLWLYNPTTEDSEIGTITDCTYTTYINAKCLNFDLQHPILKSVVRVSDCAIEVFFADGKNPRRYIDLLTPPFVEEEGCPPVETQEIDCNKLLLQPNFSIPTIEVIDVPSDGGLIAGTYQFAIQYANINSEGYTAYYSVTNPLPIFDPNRVTQDFNYPIGKSINLSIKRLDTTGYFETFNLAVIKTINNIPSVELVGTFDITGPERNISYTGQSKTDIVLSIDEIFEKFPVYEVAQDVTTAQDVLIWDQLSTQERVSFQKIANKVTLQWQTWKINHDKPYADELNAVYLRGYMRDEVYPYELVFLYNNGHQTDGFHIPGRTATSSDLEPIANNDTIDGNLDECHPTSSPLPRWQVYNTGCLEGFEPEYEAYINGTPQTPCPKCPPPTSTNPSDPKCYVGPYQYGCMAYWESTERYPCNPEIWGELADTPIRHHKFPDSLITHIHDNNGSVYPIGIKIDLAQIWNLLQNSDLTEEQKARVVGVKIVRGNRANNKTILAKGIIHNMGKYEKESQTYLFPNYPYNDLNPDRFLGATQTSDDDNDENDNRLYAFSTDDSRNRFTFHSPDTHFYQPFLGNVLKLETAEFGRSRGHFQEVKKHSRYKFLTTGAYVAALAAAIAIAAAGTGVDGLSTESGVATFMAFVEIVDKLIPRSNFTYQYNSVGDYTDFVAVQNSGNKQRFIDLSSYLVPGMTSAGDIYRINNYQRESSIFLRSNKTLPYTHEVTGVPQDNSRWVLSDNSCVNEILEKDISSYYCSIKRRYNNQYGQIYSYETIDTGYQFFFDDIQQPVDYVSVFGGDTFISRFGYKSKIPFFIDNRVNFPDDADIEYQEVGNVAFPLYWFSTGYNDGTGGVGIFEFFKQLMGVKVNNFDCDSSTVFYQKGKIYLFAYGVPYFYCETDVNIDLRQAYNDKEGDFYPHVGGDIPDEWFQESNVSINNDNTYWYNKTYSKQNKENVFSHLPEDFAADECIEELPFRAIFSDPNDWFTYRPVSYFDFPQNYGRLVSLDGIENRAVIARFENKSLIYNALLTAPTSAQDVYLGQSLFDQDTPPLDFGESDIGYMGTQHKFFLKTENGHISADSDRGQVFLISGTSAKSITDAEEVSMFFSEFLSFEMKKYFPDLNIDNHFSGIGLHGVFDGKYNRLILTKLDYIPLNDDIEEREGRFYIGNVEINLTDEEYFCNNSFTISYSFRTGGWTAFHTYLPLLYINEAKRFSLSRDGSSIWEHGRDKTKYNNFFGSIAPYVIEHPFSYQYEDELLQNIQEYTKVIKYTDWQSFVETDDVWYNKIMLYNNQQHSGVIIPTPKKLNDLSQHRKFPVYNTDSKEVLFTKKDNLYQLNTFWSVTKDPKLPIWKKSCESLSVFKELDQSNCDYGKRSYKKAPLKAKDLRVRLINDDKDDYKFISIFLIAPTQKSYV